MGGSRPPHGGLYEEDQGRRANHFCQKYQDNQASHSCKKKKFLFILSLFLLVLLFLLSLFVIVFQWS